MTLDRTVHLLKRAMVVPGLALELALLLVLLFTVVGEAVSVMLGTFPLVTMTLRDSV